MSHSNSVLHPDARGAMLARRPGVHPLMIARSTFTGAGAHVAISLGDNFNSWRQYWPRYRGRFGYGLDFPDIHGWRGYLWMGYVWRVLSVHEECDTTPTPQLVRSSIGQEFYRWPVVAQSARDVLNIRWVVTNPIVISH
ncbi:glycoside hydrolase family 31 protein [Collybiopsis luxurians FD-317 M1]|uniref:Unplaced genomic scaffold GYMLUscaffold_184, whole genome shotgun sequence n=1 Tax=Collybiopsis luxurians FD-317 M1 TaxID=944289 RepID=A0A0D0AIW6_9AGAR|nr:glycoside hydrolase family 31 protein [Collybiopsis luxurians FD-317 M1]